MTGDGRAHSGSLPSSMAYKFRMIPCAVLAAASVLDWLFSRRLSPSVTSPGSAAARVKNDGPYVSAAGASAADATV